MNVADWRPLGCGDPNAAETQGEHECSLLRVKGTKQIFSCYQIGENVYACDSWAWLSALWAKGEW